MKARKRSVRGAYSKPISTVTKGFCVLLGAAAASVAAGAASAQELQSHVTDQTDLEVVDCLLPGQVRRLGANLTYMTPRRPARLVARDCVRRHGEYVAFDAAKYDDALKLWLEQANTGDAEAQTMVGEFYEQGMGVSQDYAEAARWYEKAADQDFSRAQLNLAYLYEQGLGVERDAARAVNLYRRGTGIKDDDLVFKSELLAERAESQRVIENLANQLEDQNDQVETLQSQLALTQQRLSQRRSDFDAVQAEVNELQAQLETARASAGGARQAELENLQAKLDAREQELARRMREVTDLEAKNAAQRASLAEELQRASRKDTQLQSRLSQQSTEMQSLREQLEKTQDSLYASEKKKAELESKLATERLQLSADRESYGDENQTLTDQQRRELEARQQRITEQQAEIETLREQRRQALKQLVVLRERERALMPQPDADQSAPRAELASMQQRLMETDQRVADLTAELKAERERFEAEREKLAARASASDATQTAELQRLREQLTARESQLTDQQKLIDSLREESSSYRDQIVKLQTRDTPQLAMRSIGPRSSDGGIGASKKFARDAGLGEFYALVIGNSNYSQLENLDTAAADAKSIADVLSEKYAFKVKLLVDATRKDIIAALYDYTSILKPSDSFLIYYAGHGELDQRDSRGYWLPVDASRNNPGEWIEDQVITRYAAQFAARHVLIVADSCYSGAMTRNSSVRLTTRDPGDPEKEAQLFSALATLKSRTVLTSGGQQPVLSDGGGGHSVFARQLLDLLQRNDRVLDGTTLYNDLFNGVTQAAAQFDIRQTPQYSQIADAGHGQGDFLFVPTS
jgi:TPR repeat protein